MLSRLSNHLNYFPLSTTLLMTSTPSVTTSFAIDASAVGRVIGAGGETIRATRVNMGRGGYIRVESQRHPVVLPSVIPDNRKIKITIDDAKITFVVPAGLTPGGTLEVVIVNVSTSAPEGVSAVIAAARSVIRSAEPPFIGQCSCPTEYAPMLIGRGGCHLKAIQKEVGTGCRIFYDREGCVFDIQAATAEHLEDAMSRLHAKIEGMSTRPTTTFVSLDDADFLG